jgi:hypothetical protein
MFTSLEAGAVVAGGSGAGAARPKEIAVRNAVARLPARRRAREPSSGLALARDQQDFGETAMHFAE